MPQISFTKNNEHVYDRFSRLLLEEQLKRGKLTAPQFLDLVLDGFELLVKCEALNRAEEENPTESGSHMGLEVSYCVKQYRSKPTLYRVEEWEREGSTWEPINETK